MPSRALLLLNPGARRGGEASLDTSAGRLAALDGEIGGRTPARFRVIPGAIEVFVPGEAA